MHGTQRTKLPAVRIRLFDGSSHDFDMTSAPEEDFDLVRSIGLFEADKTLYVPGSRFTLLELGNNVAACHRLDSLEVVFGGVVNCEAPMLASLAGSTFGCSFVKQ
jgi:hypothetical protein